MGLTISIYRRKLMGNIWKNREQSWKDGKHMGKWKQYGTIIIFHISRIKHMGKLLKRWGEHHGLNVEKWWKIGHDGLLSPNANRYWMLWLLYLILDNTNRYGFLQFPMAFHGRFEVALRGPGPLALLRHESRGQRRCLTGMNFF